MTTYSTTMIDPGRGTANSAAINAWGSAISGSFSTCGLTQASDSGQINWITGTPTYSTSANGTYGYEIWKFSDTLQSTKPIYLKVNYKWIAGSGTYNFAYITITVGTGSNGSGTLTGLVGTETHIGTGTAYYGSASGNSTVYASGDGSYLTLCLYNSNANSTTVSGLGTFYIDRTRSATGTATGDGAVYGFAGNNNLSNGYTGGGCYSVMNFTLSSLSNYGAAANNASANSQGSVLPAVIQGTLSQGTVVYVNSPTIQCNSKILPPILGVVAFYAADIGAVASTISVTISGSTHTYLCMGTYVTCADRQSGNSNAALALRYE